MITLSESIIECSRRTTPVSRCSCVSYSAPATSAGSAGRGITHRRPSPTCGGLTMCGPTLAGFVASMLSGLPTGAGSGGVVSGILASGSGRPKPPLGPTPRRVPPNGGSSCASGMSGGIMVINPCRPSMRHDAVTSQMTSATWIAALPIHVNRRRRDGTARGSNSGEHLSQPLRRLDQPRRVDRERQTEKPLAPPTGAEPAPGERHYARVLERPARERRRRHSLGQRHPHVHRGPRRLGLEPLRAQHREQRVAPLLKPRHVPPRQLLRLR